MFVSTGYSLLFAPHSGQSNQIKHLLSGQEFNTTQTEHVCHEALHSDQ